MLFEHHDNLPSTNDRAMEVVRQWQSGQSPEPVVVSAASQSQGRGRQGRVWQSDIGGAWFSLAWPWRGPLAQAGLAPLVTGLAVVEAVQSLTGLPAEALTIKWPNDVLLHGKKLVGILCEQVLPQANARPAAGASDRPVTGLVVGVGINVSQRFAQDLQAFRLPPTSLLEAGVQNAPTPQAVVFAAAQAIGHRLNQLSKAASEEATGLPADMKQAIEARLSHRGQIVHLSEIATGATTSGRLVGLDDDGALRLVHPTDPTQVFHCKTGEMTGLTEGEKTADSSGGWTDGDQADGPVGATHSAHTRLPNKTQPMALC